MMPISTEPRFASPENPGARAAEKQAELLAGYPALLTVDHLHELTGLSAQTLRSLINSGDLPGCRIGRRLYVPQTQLVAYVEKGVRG